MDRDILGETQNIIEICAVKGTTITARAMLKVRSPTIETKIL
jgi:hypothetical protein